MPRVIGASKVSSKFQVTVPQRVRETLRIEAADVIVFAEEDGKVYITTEIKP